MLQYKKQAHVSSKQLGCKSKWHKCSRASVSFVRTQTAEQRGSIPAPPAAAAAAAAAAATTTTTTTTSTSTSTTTSTSN